MSVFTYDPEAVNRWAKGVIDFINGGSESIASCSKKFGEQIEKLVQPNVWTGTAAKQNYQNFLDTHQALIDFSNKFGMAFEEGIKNVNVSVGNLEAANLGQTSTSSSFGSLNFNQISALAVENIKTDVIRYDYATIASIGVELNNIAVTLSNVNQNLDSKVKELNNGSGIWDGDAAERNKNELVNVLKTGMDKITETLNICIKNIKDAAESARNIDR